MDDYGWIEYTQNWDAVDDESAAWPIFAVAASTSSELIYTGDSSGRLTTFTLNDPEAPLDRQTSILCAQTSIRHICPMQAEVFVQSDDAVQVITNGGRKVFARTTSPNDAFTAAAISQDSKTEAFVCTSAGAGSLLDLATGRLVKRASVEISSSVALLGRERLVLGTADGMLAVRDPRAAFNLVQAATVFGGPVVDLAMHGWSIFACGAQSGQDASYQPVADTTIKVYDVRNLSQPLAPIELGAEEDEEVSVAPSRLQVCDGELWICHDSGYAETRTLASGGQEVGPSYIEPALDEYSFMSAFCITPSGQVALVADTAGILHVWSSSEEPLLSRDGRVADILERSDSMHSSEWPPCGQDVSIDDESISLSCVEMPAIREPLLSRMGTERWDVGRPVSFVDPGILGSLKMMDAVGYAPNPRTGRRNQQHYGRGWRQRWKGGATGMDDDGELTHGRSKFLSQQRRWGQSANPSPVYSSVTGDGGSVSGYGSAPSSTRDAGAHAASSRSVAGSPAMKPATVVTGTAPSGKVPKHMQQMRIAYSRFGVEDFDFSLYNSTRWSGLEGNISNAYANALLQLLFFSAEFRALMLSHCASNCPEPNCLSCQLGLLFRMLASANGASCHATLLLRVLSERPEAAALALLEELNGSTAAGATAATATVGAGSGGLSYALLAQRLMRFFLEQTNNECQWPTSELPLYYLKPDTGDAPKQRVVEHVFGFPQQTRTTCPVCKTANDRESHVFSVDLEPPQGTAGLASVLAGGLVSVKRAESQRNSRKADMLGLIERSLARLETTRAWCACCKKFQLLQTEKRITRAPVGYLALNFPALASSQSLSGGGGSVAAGLLSNSATATTAETTSAAVSGGALGTQAGSGLNEDGCSWQMTLPTSFELSVGADDETSDHPVQVRAADHSDASAADAVAEGDGALCPSSVLGGAKEQFQLVALVSSIRDVRRGPEHLIVHVRDPEDPTAWLLFNDFLVQPVTEDSVVGLYDWWRVPSIAIYANAQRQQLDEVVDAVCRHHPYRISTKILTTPKSVLDVQQLQYQQQLRQQPSYLQRSNPGRLGSPSSLQNNNNNNSRMRNRAVPLSKVEAGLLERGEFKCALDAEFVVLEEAKMEVFSDGTRSLHRPPMHALARLSAVRANGGDLHGVPFIDDYVAISRPIADLATLYSGIHAGDLAVGISPYKLSTMKEVYKKLRLLVDSHCVFIGHGLKHDFRVCNISVPIALQRDTMLLFQSPSHIRPISLRFLYWYFYRKSIQTREHSSVEDAQATLKVYESYCKCVDGKPDDAIESVLDAIYTVGANMSWKLPDQKI
ncbi:poly(A)-specific ribonuclease [Coemansia sp. RSA 988]|nr:poly(A)-specific ribonuclease [Coemansia sp. RSA 988]